VHTCRTAGVVRDLFQLTVRIGRFDGGLIDKTMYVVIQDSSPQKKEAQRKSYIEAGRPVTQRMTLNTAIREVVSTLNTQQEYNENQLVQCGTGRALGIESWWKNVAAHNLMEKYHSRAFHSETVHEYFTHRGTTVTLVRGDSGIVDVRSVVGDWTNKIKPESRVPAVVDLYTTCTDGDDDDVFLSRLMDGSVGRHEALSTKEKAVQDVFYKIMQPYGWDPRTDRDYDPKPYFTLWKPSVLRRVKNFTMQLKEELLATQQALDETKVVDESGKVDKTVKTDAQRVQGGRDLCRLLGPDSLVNLDGFALPADLVAKINAQHPSSSEAANGIGGDFAELYTCLKLVGARGLVTPDCCKPRKKGSKTHEDLRSAMKLFGLEETWDRKGEEGFQKAWRHVGRRDVTKMVNGQPKIVKQAVYKLCPGYGFKPDEEIQGLSLDRLVHHSVADMHVPLRDLKDHIDAADQERFEEMLWEETEHNNDLGAGTQVDQTCPGQYVEKLNYRALVKLLPHAQRGLAGWNLDREVTHGKNKRLTKRGAMVRDIQTLLQHGKDHGAEESGLIHSTVTYEYKYDSLGRRYARAGVPTLQGMAGGVRKTAAEGIYWDMDFEDCYNTILYAVSKHYNFPTDLRELLHELTEDKDEVRKDVARFYGCTVKAAKNLLLKHWMGGKVNKWLRDFKISQDVCARVARDGHHPIVPRLEAAAPRVCTMMINSIAPLRPFLEHVNEERSRAGQEPKTEYTALSYGLQTIEDKLLGETERLLHTKGYGVDSCQFDGLYVARNGATGDFPEEIRCYVQDNLAILDVGAGLKVPMKLAEKTVKTPYNLDGDP
jgi:hypothetical protein